MKVWPKLFKKVTTGAIQFWEIEIQKQQEIGYVIHTNYGQYGGYENQTFDNITKGKNSGRVNETSIEQQAEKIANKKWEAKKKSGYVEDINDAKNEITDVPNEHRILPMVPQLYKEHGHKIKWPALVELHSIGHEYLADIVNGECSFIEENGKTVSLDPSVKEELERVFFKQTITLHGILTDYPSPPQQRFKIFDVVGTEPFVKRWSNLNAFLSKQVLKWCSFAYYDYISGPEHLPTFLTIAQEHENPLIIIRNDDAPYAHRRTAEIQIASALDLKTEVFKVLDVEEGKGQFKGFAVGFVCKTENGHLFSAKIAFKTESWEDYFLQPELCVGKLVKVIHHGLNEHGIPQFPVSMDFKEPG